MGRIKLREIAYTRSGDKGSTANIGVIAYSESHFLYLQEVLTAERVESYFRPMGAKGVKRYLLPKLWAMNFVLPDLLSDPLRIDAQGKTLGQLVLEMELEELS